MNLLLKQCNQIHRWSTGLWKLPAVFQPKFHPRSRPSIRNLTGQTNVLKTSDGKPIGKLPEAKVQRIYPLNKPKKYKDKILSCMVPSHLRLSGISVFGLMAAGLLVGVILTAPLVPVDAASEETTDMPNDTEIRSQNDDKKKIHERSPNAEIPSATDDMQDICSCKEEPPECNTEADTADEKSNQCCKKAVGPEERAEILNKKIEKLGQYLKTIQKEDKIPGISVAVSVDGEMVWAAGTGYADIEDAVPCTQATVFNIGGITRSITMAAVAKLWEEGKLDIDEPVQHYVPEFPEKYWNDKKMIITTRHLISDLAGMGHTIIQATGDNSNKNQNAVVYTGLNSLRYDSVIESLDKFKNDALVAPPGQPHYSNYGWDLAGAVVERAAGIPFKEYINKMLQDLDMTSTRFAQLEDIVPQRARRYANGNNDTTQHAPYIDFSDLLPAEGLFSNVLDLVKFGNTMLSFYMAPEGSDVKPQFLSAKTMGKMWPPKDLRYDGDEYILRKYQGLQYPMGWNSFQSKKSNKFVVYQLGFSPGVLGALFVLPPYTNRCSCSSGECSKKEMSQGKGVVISILANKWHRMVESDIKSLCNIAYEFSQVDKKV